MKTNTVAYPCRNSSTGAGACTTTRKISVGLYWLTLIGLVLPRDAMHSADYAVTRCPSVYLSVTRRYSV